MTTFNEAWMDALIRHQVGLMRLAPGISLDVNKLLNASEGDLVRQIRARYQKGMGAKRLESLLTSVRAARSTAWKDVDQLWADAMEEVAQSEPAFLDSALNTLSPAVLNTTLPTAERMSAIAKATPFQGSVMSDWASKVQEGDIARIEQAIKVGLTQGDNVDGIVKRVVGTAQLKGTDGVTQITRNNADSITRTAVNAIANQAKQEYYAANSDILDTEVFLATLDARTTLVCASNDNKQFPLGEGPIPPLHWRCRSLRLAVINGEVIGTRPMRNFTEKQLLREYAEANSLGAVKKRDSLPHGHKTSFDTFARKRMRELTGTVPSRTSYNEWFERQAPSFQDDVLGKTRADMFRNGDLTLDKFVNANGDKLTLKQLQIRDEFQLDQANPTRLNAKVDSSVVAAEYAQLGKPEVRFDLIDGTTKNYGAPKALVEQVSGELKRLGWNDLFKGYGGASIEWHGGRIPGAATSNGRMAGKQGKMWLTTDRRTVKSKSGWSISENMETASERVLATAIHEYGHAVHLYEMPGSASGAKLAKKVDDIISTRFNAADREFLTKYADANHKEYFAESFSAYHTNPMMLQRQAPKAYAMVEEVLDARKLPKNGMSATPSKTIAKKSQVSSVLSEVLDELEEDSLTEDQLEALLEKTRAKLNMKPAPVKPAPVKPAPVKPAPVKPAPVKPLPQREKELAGTVKRPAPAPDVVRALKQQSEVLAQNLTEQEAAAIRYYSDTGSVIMRRIHAGATDEQLLKEFRTVSPEGLKLVRQQVKDLDSAMSKLEINNPTAKQPLYRGVMMPDEQLQQLLDSKVWDHGEFRANSASYSMKVAHRFAKDTEPGMSRVIFRYNKVKKASLLMDESLVEDPSELEVLLGKGRYRVTSPVFDTAKQQWVIDLEPE